jgi:hypothetical protein
MGLLGSGYFRSLPAYMGLLLWIVFGFGSGDLAVRGIRFFDVG